jgi:DNA-binding MarR family transcriptional regulator
VPPTPHNHDHFRRILDEVERGGELSQRALATILGVSLGRANQLLRTLIDRQWVRGVPGSAHRVHYVLTADGEAARAQLSREHLDRALAVSGTVRARVRQRLEACTIDRCNGDGAPTLVLYGVGEAAQIAFACAAELGLQLVGFIDDVPRESFLGLPVRGPSALTPMALDGIAFDWLLVASVVNQEAIRTRLEEVGFPLDRVSWL